MAETITMPKLGFDMQEGTLVRWVRTEGETVNKGDVLAEIETDKATVEVESSAGGVIRKLLVDQGAVVPIGAPIAIVGMKDEPVEAPSPALTGAEPATEAAKQAAPAPPPTRSAATAVAPTRASVVAAPTPPSGPVKASPLARRMARDANIDLSQIRGTGPGGRVVRKDLEAAAQGGAPSAARFAISSVPIVARADVTIPVTRLRQAIGRRMAESKSSVPHFYVTHEYDVESLMDLREQANSVIGGDEKLSVNDFVIKAVSLCLREFPNLNSAFQGEHVLRHGAVSIGVAVAVEGGLLTVVCKDADQKSVRQISSEVKQMAARARSGKVHPADIEASTFTVSNLGMYDVENFGAIINPPEAGILAVGSARHVPVVQDGEVRAGWRMKATIAVDHRVSDGAEAAQFMQALAKYIETPLSLFL